MRKRHVIRNRGQMTRISKGFILVVFVCRLANGQVERPKSAAEHASNMSLASHIGFGSVVLSRTNRARLQLTGEQIQQLEKIRNEYRKVSRAHLLASLPDDPPKGDLFEFAAKVRQTPEWHAERARMRKALEDGYRKTLLPRQVETPIRIMLRQRYEIAGIEAVLISTDVPLVANSGFDRPVREILDRVKEADNQDDEEIERLKSAIFLD